VIYTYFTIRLLITFAISYYGFSLLHHQLYSCCCSPAAAIVGDDADLVLMAMVCQQHRLLVINGALNDGRMSPSMPVFSVPRLHSEWTRTILHADAANSVRKVRVVTT
jgi:hypothetical protein